MSGDSSFEMRNASATGEPGGEGGTIFVDYSQRVFGDLFRKCLVPCSNRNILGVTMVLVPSAIVYAIVIAADASKRIKLCDRMIVCALRGMVRTRVVSVVLTSPRSYSLSIHRRSRLDVFIDR